MSKFSNIFSFFFSKRYGSKTDALNSGGHVKVPVDISTTLNSFNVTSFYRMIWYAHSSQVLEASYHLINTRILYGSIHHHQLQITVQHTEEVKSWMILFIDNPQTVTTPCPLTPTIHLRIQRLQDNNTFQRSITVHLVETTIIIRVHLAQLQTLRLVCRSHLMRIQLRLI